MTETEEKVEVKEQAEKVEEKKEQLAPAAPNKPKRKHRTSQAKYKISDDKRQATKENISEVIRNNLKWTDGFRMNMVRTPEECARRLSDFFAVCAETGEIPTVEKMMTCLGTYRQKLAKWRTGELPCDPEVLELIDQGIHLISAIDAELALGKQISEVVYIFRSKNFYGMRDNQFVEIQRNRIGDMVSREQLEERIRGTVIDVEWEDT